jgi:hypothetical protein
MDFNFSEEQSMLRDTVASFLRDKYSTSRSAPQDRRLR